MLSLLQFPFVYIAVLYTTMQFVKRRLCVFVVCVCVSQMIFDETYFLVVMVCLSHTNYTHLSTLSLFNILHALKSFYNIIKMIIIGFITWTAYHLISVRKNNNKLRLINIWIILLLMRISPPINVAVFTIQLATLS